ncbi:dihydroorotase [Acinetobacter populi]|uniref:Aspartate carbamoyltransferase n=1 Tax=Acinetobacter populi TaxID=1582270 RepID=A0A1Z9YUM0_9GAMM|nr:dihydroorotase [Acinetobacter populi]OUY05900.1 aspartate carbamoyltransferase [Acinetobacter populi]
MSNIVKIENVRVLNPVTQTDQVQTVYLNEGKIVAETDIDQAQITRVDGTGKWLMPTMLDLCARLREPGQQQHGTLKSEGHAARQNGILHVITPPDSKPIVQDNGALIQGLKEKALKDGDIYLHIIGAQTQGLKGQQPANMAGLQKGGCIAVSNANAAFADDDVVIRTLEYAAGLGLKVVFYAEEPEIAKDGCVHEGFIASRQGLPMIPPMAETVAIAKYLQMIEATGVSAHFGLLSCGASVELIAQAKAKGLPVTADVAMHQLHLTDIIIDGFNSLAHVRPPLRSEQDKIKLREGVKSGVIDAICTHHEPLSASAKMAPFAETESGFSAFDSFVALGVQLVKDDLLSPLQWVEKVTTQAAKIFDLTEVWQQQSGWVLVNPEQQWVLDKHTILSNGKNTPLLGTQLQGKVEQVFS